MGILLLSVSRVWSLTPVPSVYTLGNYEEILVRSPQFIANTVRYAGLAALLDVALGAVIAWLLLRGRVRGRQWLDTISTVPLAIPGVVIAVGYLRAFGSFRVPGLGELPTPTWLILVIVYAVRRLPYAVRGLRGAALARAGGGGPESSEPAGADAHHAALMMRGSRPAACSPSSPRRWTSRHDPAGAAWRAGAALRHLPHSSRRWAAAARRSGSSRYRACGGTGPPPRWRRPGALFRI